MLSEQIELCKTITKPQSSKKPAAKSAKTTSNTQEIAKKKLKRATQVLSLKQTKPKKGSVLSQQFPEDFSTSPAPPSPPKGPLTSKLPQPPAKNPIQSPVSQPAPVTPDLKQSVCPPASVSRVIICTKDAVTGHTKMIPTVRELPLKALPTENKEPSLSQQLPVLKLPLISLSPFQLKSKLVFTCPRTKPCQKSCSTLPFVHTNVLLTELWYYVYSNLLAILQSLSKSHCNQDTKTQDCLIDLTALISTALQQVGSTKQAQQQYFAAHKRVPWFRNARVNIAFLCEMLDKYVSLRIELRFPVNITGTITKVFYMGLPTLFTDFPSLVAHVTATHKRRLPINF